MKSDNTKIYERHYEDHKLIPVSAELVFAYIDDHMRLSSHMNRSSLMSGGGRMHTTVDTGQGKEIGSHIRMNGRAFGITLFLDEVVIYREPPIKKVWETVGQLKLLVVGNYRMKVEIEPQEDGSLLYVRIDYDLPETNTWLGKLFSGTYAKWCVQQMIKDTYNHFK